MFFRKRNRKLIAGLMLGAAAICLVTAAVSFAYSWNFVHHAARTTGKVTELTQRSEDYYPVFTFDDANGVHHTINSDTGSSSPKYKIGDKITVLYSPANPDNAAIDDFFSSWGIPLVTGLLAAFYLPLGLIIWFWPTIAAWFKNKRKPQSIPS